jgi:hypothetical protein
MGSAPDLVEQTIAESIGWRETTVADLGVTRVLVRANVSALPALRYFSRVLEPAGTTYDYELFCIDPQADGLDGKFLRAHADPSFRGQRFRGGFYLTHHFGPPATLISRGNHHYVIGGDFDRIVWGWYVKFVLSIHSLRAGSLHLKAGCIGHDGEATLLVGRGGGGKTVLLTQMCGDGAEFISNTHVVVDGDGLVHGVPTALRVRDAPCFRELIRSGQLRTHLDGDEFVADPAALFPRSAPSAHVRNVCVVDYHDGASRIAPLSASAAYDLFEQFGFPINTYGMKDDILEAFGGDLAAFTTGYAAMKAQLRALVDGASCFYVSCDMMLPENRARLRDALGMGGE